jgi:hypothetical protein
MTSFLTYKYCFPFFTPNNTWPLNYSVPVLYLYPSPRINIGENGTMQALYDEYNPVYGDSKLKLVIS